MGAYKYIAKSFRKEYAAKSPELKQRLLDWRASAPVTKIERPTNITRARELGYKAKEGVILARIRVAKGKSKRRMPRSGRKPSKAGRFFALTKSLQSRAEDRAASKFTNCEVLNSYYVGEDGNNAFYEVMLLDRAAPSIKSDKEYAAIANQKHRAIRGLTSSGKRHRGIIVRNAATDRNRPSVRKSRGR